MVTFMCQLSWAIGFSDIILGMSMRVFLDEINFWISRLSEPFALPNLGSHAMLSRFSCVWFFATLWTIVCQAPLVHGILQARILDWVAISFSRGFSWPRNWTHIYWSSCLVGGFFTTEPWGRPSVPSVAGSHIINWRLV